MILVEYLLLACFTVVFVQTTLYYIWKTLIQFLGGTDE